MNGVCRSIGTLAVPSFLFIAAAAVAGCAAAHGGPLLGSGEPPPEMSGTISGIVRAADTNTPLSARKITATEISSGRAYSATTATNGGYTIKVPMGRYRIAVELAPGEAIRDAPDEVVINRSDLDSGRDFLVAVRP